jgi:hypothetical protein
MEIGPTALSGGAFQTKHKALFEEKVAPWRLPFRPGVSVSKVFVHGVWTCTRLHKYWA